ncbi:MAG: hypothetical protein KF891_05800 [Rhizobacter sp.]|nr:hypothetical protein [Rhizobacter sp.]
MQAPVSMLTGAGNGKAATVFALLIGLAVVAALKQQRPPAATTATTLR